jgi:hypothetical protein
MIFGPKDRAELTGLDRLILSAPDPRVDDAAVAALLELLQQPAQSAEQATEPVARRGLLRRRRWALSASALSAPALEQRTRGEQAQEGDHQRLRDVSAGKRIANDVIEICHRLLLRYLTQRPRTRGHMLRRPTNR